MSMLFCRRAGKNHPPSLDPPISFENSRNGLRIELMLDRQNATRQPVRTVPIEHRHRLLQHNRPRIESRSDEMDRRSSHLDAVLEGLTLRVDPGERGQERRVNVENALGKRLAEGR